MTANPEPSPPPRWQPLLRRGEQAILASVVGLSLLGMMVAWFWQRGDRGGLIEIDRATPIEISYLVDINRADWPERTSLQLLRKLSTSIIFSGADVGQIQFDHRETPGIDAAEQFLRRYLADGPRHWSEIVEAAPVSFTCLHRARRRMGLLVAVKGESRGCWALT